MVWVTQSSDDYVQLELTHSKRANLYMDVVYVSAHAVYHLHLSQISQCTSAESSAKYYLFKAISVAEIGLLPCLFLCPQELHAVFCEVLDGMGKERDSSTSRLSCAVMATLIQRWLGKMHNLGMACTICCCEVIISRNYCYSGLLD